MILLKDTSISLNIEREWIPFSTSSSAEDIFHSVASAITNINKRVNLDTNLIGTIAVGLIGFIIGWTLNEKIISELCR